MIWVLSTFCKLWEGAKHNQSKPAHGHICMERHTGMRLTAWLLVSALCSALLKTRSAKSMKLHLMTSMRTLAEAPIPMARAAPLLRSIERPFTNGPRSLIRTITDRPGHADTVNSYPSRAARLADWEAMRDTMAGPNTPAMSVSSIERASHNQ